MKFLDTSGCYDLYLNEVHEISTKGGTCSKGSVEGKGMRLPQCLVTEAEASAGDRV